MSTPRRRTMSSHDIVESDPTGVRFGPRSAPAKEPISPSLFVYVAGLFVLVSGVESSGLTGTLVSGLARLITSSTSAVVAGVIGTGVGSNLINNFPAVLVMLSGVQSSHMAPQMLHSMRTGHRTNLEALPPRSHVVESAPG
jgi:hypothetical protein